MASGETKTWLTPKRIARGPYKADEELRRWAKTAFRPAKVYGSIAAMRADAVASREKHVGSALIASEPAPIFTTGELLAIAGATVGAFFFGRWLGRRRAHPRSSTTVHGDAPTNRYVSGTLALCA